jgi:fatty acid amide hydrolase
MSGGAALHSPTGSEHSSEIIECGAAELARRLRDGDLSAVEVLEAHIARIEEVDPALNAVVVRRFEAARDEAQRADAATQRGESRGVLHGVPVTVKECFALHGTPATGGLAGLGSRELREGGVVRALRDVGAIILGKTNLSQGLWFNEADNPIYGRTNNPWDLSRSSGGSSGGEGAIVAAHGSPLGVGTDSGGSIRYPAAWCGVHGFKPSSGLLATDGTVDDLLFAGIGRQTNQPGPLARYVEDLRLFMRAVSADESEACPGEALTSLSGLRVAYYDDDGTVKPSPAIARAVREAVGALEARGAGAIAFDPPEVAEAIRVHDWMFSFDRAVSLRELVADGPLDARLGQILDRIESASPGPDELALQQIAGRYRERFASLLEAVRADVIVCPALPLVAVPHGSGHDLEPIQSYGGLYNLLGYPAGVVSITGVREDEQTADRRPGSYPIPSWARRTEQNSHGLPVAVQVAAPHGYDQLVLDVMQVLQDAFSQQPDYPLALLRVKARSTQRPAHDQKEASR